MSAERNAQRARILLDGLHDELLLLADHVEHRDRGNVSEQLEELAAMARVIRRELGRLVPAP